MGFSTCWANRWGSEAASSWAQTKYLSSRSLHFIGRNGIYIIIFFHIWHKFKPSLVHSGVSNPTKYRMITRLPKHSNSSLQQLTSCGWVQLAGSWAAWNPIPRRVLVIQRECEATSEQKKGPTWALPCCEIDQQIDQKWEFKLGGR